MNRKLLKDALVKHQDAFDLSKFNMDDIGIEDCEIIYEDEHVIVKPHKNRRMKKYLYQCQMCDRYFLGGRDKTGEYIGNCFGNDKDSFNNKCRKNFYKSQLKIAEVCKAGIGHYKVEEFLGILRNENRKAPGVWALWEDYESKDAKCIQVARNKDIYQEIFDDFEKGQGSIDYSKYKKNGTIVIVSDKCNCLRLEAQYAHDNNAEFWNPGVGEPKQIGIAKGLRK